jgi:hypothetical protein
LKAFNVPQEKWTDYLNWARVEAKRDSGTYIRVSLGIGLDNPPAAESRFKKLKRTT